MNQEKIQETLLHLFNDDARWQGKSFRVVFWYDAEQSFQEEYQALKLSDVQKHELTESNVFQTKIILHELQPNSRCLIYAAIECPLPSDNWLLDALKYGEAFSADRASLIFTDLGFHDRALVTFLREHLTFFRSKKRLESLQALHLQPETSQNQLHIAMMSVCVGLKTPDASTVIRKVLLSGLNEAENTVWGQITNFFAPEEFWQLCEQELGYRETGEYQPSLKRLYLKLAVTHFSHAFHDNAQYAFPTSLHDFVLPISHIAYKFVDDWLHHSEDSVLWKQFAQSVSDDLQILPLVLEFNTEQYQDCDTFLAFDQGVIREVVQSLKAKSENYDRLRNLIQRRRNLHWASDCKDLYNALDAAIRLFEQYKRFTIDLNSLSAKAFFDLYAQDLHMIDRAYRHYLQASDASNSHDILKSLSEDVENLYVNGYLNQLSQSWDRVLEQELMNDWQIPFTHSQQDFVTQFIQPVMDRNDKEKVYVIISDALRYEVAAELAEYLTQKLRGNAKVKPQLGVLPSVTKLGMASLLPGAKNQLRFDTSGKVLLQGQSTQGLEARNAILEQGAKHWQGTALKARDLMDMTVMEGRERLQPFRVIYLYHDRIDMTGDKLTSEPNVFKACQETIDELTKLVSRITKSLNGTNVLITADHGFLYHRKELEDSDKITLPNLKPVDRSKRHIVADETSRIEGTYSSSLAYLGDNTHQVLVPKGNLRFKIKGGTRQFVHGGASLQEICVPVLRYKDVRVATGETGPNRKVSVQVNARHKRITNNKFTLKLLQTEPVKDKILARKIKVGFYDSENISEAITNEKVIELNKTSANALEREYKVSMTVAMTQHDTQKDYYLIIRDADDGTELIRDPWKVNLGINNDFGFDI